MMTEFLELLESELKARYRDSEVEFGYLEDYIIGKLPALLISPGTQNRKTASLSNKDTMLSFSITVVDQHVPQATKSEIQFCESVIQFFENNVEIKKNIVYADSAFAIEIKKEEEDINGIFLGKIKVNTQLRR
ncbi:MAG: hypothetical protein ACRC0G_16005 [Fusobacteriaceae bacterium]